MVGGRQSHSTVEIGQCRWREGDCIVKGLTEDTLSVLRDGGNNGNEISKNS